jgi:hypothetical protein
MLFFDLNIAEEEPRFIPVFELGGRFVGRQRF